MTLRFITSRRVQVSSWYMQEPPKEGSRSQFWPKYIPSSCLDPLPEPPNGPQSEQALFIYFVAQCRSHLCTLGAHRGLSCIYFRTQNSLYALGPTINVIDILGAAVSDWV